MAKYQITDDQVAILLAHLRHAGAVDVPTAEAKPISRDVARQLLDVLLQALRANDQGDIVTRLRIVDGDKADRLDAADEIERLRAAGDLMWHSLLMWQTKHPDRDIGTDAVDAWEEARRG